MPHFSVTITKFIDQEKWTNVYFVNAADLAGARTHATDIISIERNLHKTTVAFEKALVSEREQPYRNFSDVMINESGLAAITSGSKPLPLWNTVKVLFQPNNNGRPDYKQLRLPIHTDEQLDVNRITPAFQTIIQNDYVNPLVALGCIEDNAGNPWTSGVVDQRIHDRQLTKRRRKKVVLP